MDSTSVSLLRRLNEPDHDAAWERFVELYAPLIFHWGRNHGLTGTDAADLVQDVLSILVSKLPEFQYDPKRRFRGWLRTITLNRANDVHRRNAVRKTDGSATLDNQTVTTDVDLFEEAEYRSFLVRRALELMQTEFPQHVWRACWELVAEGRDGESVAAELGMTRGAVYVAKSRVMRRLREEMQGLLE